MKVKVQAKHQYQPSLSQTTMTYHGLMRVSSLTILPSWLRKMKSFWLLAAVATCSGYENLKSLQINNMKKKVMMGLRFCRSSLLLLWWFGWRRVGGLRNRKKESGEGDHRRKKQWWREKERRAEEGKAWWWRLLVLRSCLPSLHEHEIIIVVCVNCVHRPLLFCLYLFFVFCFYDQKFSFLFHNLTK